MQKLRDPSLDGLSRRELSESRGESGPLSQAPLFDRKTMPPPGSYVREDSERTSTSPMDAHSSQNLSMGTFLKAVVTIRSGLSPDKRRARLRAMTLPDWGYAICLSGSYATVIFCRNWLIVISATLVDAGIGYSNERHGTTLVAMGVAYGIGKAINGILVDSFDPFWCFVALSLTSVIFTLAATFTEEAAARFGGDAYLFLVIVCIGNAFAQSGTWGAAVKLIYRRYRPAQYAKVFSALGVGSRGAAVGTSFVLSGALAFTSWQNTVRIAVGITASGLCLLAATRLFPARPGLHAATMEEYDQARKPRVKFDAPAPPSDTPFSTAFATFAMRFRTYFFYIRQRRFLLMAVAYSFMNILANIDSFTGLWISDVVPFENSTLEGRKESIAAGFTAFNPLGMVVAMTFGSARLARLSRPAKATASIILLAGVLCSTAALVAVTAVISMESAPLSAETTAAVIAAVLFTLGLCNGFPYYVPTSEFTLHFDGQNAAMVTASFDIISAIIAFPFTQAVSYLSVLDGGMGWVYAQSLNLFAAVVALSSFSMFHFCELKEKKSTLRLRPELEAMSAQLELSTKRSMTLEDGVANPLDASRSEVSISAEPPVGHSDDDDDEEPPPPPPDEEPPPPPSEPFQPE